MKMFEMKDRLRKARKAAGYRSAAKAAELFTDVQGASTYTAHENGQNRFNVDQAKIYGAKFKVDWRWLLYGVDEDELDPLPRDETKRIKEIDVSAGMGGGGVALLENSTDKDGNTFSQEVVRDYWRFPDWIFRTIDADPDNVFAMRMRGDSMYPTLMDGDVGFFDLRRRVPSPPGIYALLDEFGGVIVKRLEAVPSGSGEMVISVGSDNEHHRNYEMRLDELQIIGGYVGKFSRN